MSSDPAEKSHAFIERFNVEPYHKGVLSGLSFAVKDCIDIKDKKTGCGNPDWCSMHPFAQSNAVVVDQILAQGALLKGKTITDEITFSLEGENVYYGTPLNPCVPERVPGGSSSGSASAVACGAVDFALGTDTGGSIRVPASNCGVFGFRPSHDVISTAGVMPFAPSFDTVGILAKNFEILDKVACLLLSCMSLDKPEIGKVYFVKEAFDLSDSEIVKTFAEKIANLESIFHTSQEISLDELVGNHQSRPLDKWLDTFTILQNAEIWSTHGAWIESVKPHLGAKIQANFDYAKQIDREKVGAAIALREHYYNCIAAFLKPNDLLCLPTTPLLAPLKNSLIDSNFEQEYYSKTLSVCAIAGLCRLPQITLPIASVNNVPVGLSIVGAYRQDKFLLSAARKLVKIN